MNSPSLSVLLIVLIFHGIQTLETIPNGPIVELPQGKVQGSYKKSYRNRTFSAFEGIPYAKPPVEDLRFRESIPASNWSGILNATNHYECLHYMPFAFVRGIRGTEDCLYVYVYVPGDKVDPNALLDVIVHIHGGAFMLGAPKYMAGPEFLMDRDVVVVSFNYRLGILGFLSTEDDVVPGNNGLKDQSLALDWISSNIKYFGGNPASITLTGLSAGAASVHFHYFSPLSKGLFHRGFSQSGTALLCWALAENPLEKARAVAKNISCPTLSTEKMVECLRSSDARKLINGIRTLFVYQDIVPIAPFGPVIENISTNAFLSQHPYKLLQEGNVYDVPWISSNTKDEGLFPVGLNCVHFVFFFIKVIAASKTYEEIEDKWYDIMQYGLELQYTVEPHLQKDVLRRIKKYYFKNDPISADNMESFVNLVTDRMFSIDTEKAIRMQAHAAKSDIYYYIFAYNLEMPHFPPGMPKGAAHGDDARLLFKMFMTPSVPKKKDEEMMNFFIDFLVGFAKSGVPSMNKVEWLPVKPEDSNINLLQINGPENIIMKSVTELGPNSFWSSLPINEIENAASKCNGFIPTYTFMAFMLSITFFCSELFTV
ncbi:hypothetical protein HUJ05_012772 [Dendroctonus ponderosae]|nr:hypothetical protein HUJ05_012772 [Dendroctonus ponderosae]